MNRLIVTLVLIIITGSSKLVAQIDSTQFLLLNFENGQVFFKDGRVFDASLNYSLFVKKFLFLDQQDNSIKEFSEPEMVSTIKIGKRVFKPTKNGATEILQNDPFISVQYRGTLKREGKEIGYGGRSETSAVDGLATYHSGNTGHKLETEKFILSRVDKIFRVEYNGKQYRFLNEKQFLKAFSNKKEVLMNYIKENEIDFNDIDDVLKLYNYAMKL